MATWIDYYFNPKNNKHEFYICVNNEGQVIKSGLFTKDSYVKQAQAILEGTGLDAYNQSYYLLYFTGQKLLYVSGGNIKQVIQGRDKLDLEWEDYLCIYIEEGLVDLNSLSEDIKVLENVSILDIMKKYGLEKENFM
jgi:hypothetical protein